MTERQDHVPTPGEVALRQAQQLRAVARGEFFRLLIASIARLLAYATQPDARTAAQQALILEATERRPLPADIHGSSPILRTLGSAHNPTGLGWAHPGTHYGAALARIANELGGA